jgi:hypothetical protein
MAKWNLFIHETPQFAPTASSLAQFPMTINIYMELKLMPCMFTDPGFMLTVVPSGYLCRDIWWSPAAVKSTCRVSRNPITPIG